MDNSNIANYTFGVSAGYLSYKGADKLGLKILQSYSAKYVGRRNNFSPEENDILKKAVYDGFSQSGLKKKKFYLNNINPENVDLMTKMTSKKIDIIFSKFEFYRKIEELRTQLKENNKIKSITTPLKENINQGLKVAANGNNAFCFPIISDIMINMDKCSESAFHEMGHALNFSGSKLTKAFVFGCRMITLPVSLIFAIGLLKPKKKEGEKPNGIIDKTTTFIKNNTGKLTFATFVPILAEEGLASIRGCNIAKKVLNLKFLKRINRTNFFAWTTYFISALMTAGMVALSVKIRDKVAEK